MSDLADRIHRKLTDREAKLDTLLTHYPDAQTTLYAGTTTGGMGDDRLLLMPAVWTLTYRRLEMSCRWLRSTDTSSYWHLAEWYLRCQRKPRERLKRVPSKQGWLWVSDGREYVVFRDPKVEPARVLTGLEALSVRWARCWAEEPFVPEEIRGRKGEVITESSLLTPMEAA